MILDGRPRCMGTPTGDRVGVCDTVLDMEPGTAVYHCPTCGWHCTRDEYDQRYRPLREEVREHGRRRPGY